MKPFILDESGQPRPFYHGSCKAIPVFGPLRYDGVGGAYFTPSHEMAVDLAIDGCMEDGDEPTVMTAHLRIANPFFMYGIDSQEITLTRIAELKALGYDGVIGHAEEGAEPFEYVAFDPDQVEVVSCDIVKAPGISP